MISVLFFQFISFILFSYGFLGTFLIKRNLIMVLVCIELLLVSIQLNFIVNAYNL
jgi:NADH:ubiquinone oxidoreductase subunit K